MNPTIASFPASRTRRLRARKSISNLIRENKLSTSDLIWPLFVQDRTSNQTINSMPGVSRLSIKNAVAAAAEAVELGIPAIAIFPHVSEHLKTPDCKEAWNPENLANRTTRAIRKSVPNIEIMLDVALDPYNVHGHDGLFANGQVLNDETLECLTKQALSHAKAGATILGPSDMMDGRIGRIRESLEANNYKDIILFSYAAKYASAFYDPFRNSIGSRIALKGSKETYQINPSNSDEAIRVVQRDLKEGADAIIIKPGTLYLDICQRVSQHFRVPTFAYQVSGEFAMFHAAAANGWIDLEKAMLESLISFKRAGCTGIISYFAPNAAKYLNVRGNN